ncbi:MULTISPECIES: G5 domain-containing protein [Caproicibacterium]|uniref:G5 domain-containing protein n=1 Tax=Caproicibacterium argilliputei TaxID=3030016 RepID=A0AA97H140_9FIRM|nr:G5 domain-containing protein [Caproicibacterium argilliputei]WOC32236.1 G5 domain-containing protein [Caproicibacterium argilliputei]
MMQASKQNRRRIVAALRTTNHRMHIESQVNQMHMTGKTLIVLGAVFTVGLGTASTVIATTQNAVVTKNGETQKLYMLTSDDTSDILKSAGVRAGHGDLVLRSTNAQGSIEVNVRTAYPVDVLADGSTKQVTAHFGDTVRDVLQEAGVALGPVDTVNVPLDQPVTENTKLRICRNHIVTVKADGVSTQVVAATDTPAQQAVQRAGVTLSKEDELAEGTDQTITVNRVTYKDEVLSETIPFETVTEEDDGLLVGESQVKAAGTNGSKKVVRRTKFVNGKAASTSVVSTEVVKNAVDRVVVKGTKERPQEAEESRSAESSSASSQQSANGLSYSRVLTGKCTAYTGGGVTATGVSAAVGRVAVDPNEIPYGTRLYIASPDGSYVYGYAVAADTGGFVYSSSTMADLYMDTQAECENFGRRTMNIYILD